MSPRTQHRDDSDHERSAPLAALAPRYSRSLQRGLAILACFTPSRPVLGIADIASELHISRSTTHRYMSTLHALDYLEQLASRKYRLSPRVTDLGMSTISSISLQDHSRAYLTELRRHATGTVSLAVLDGPTILYIEQARGLQGHSHATVARTGARLPIHCTATGKLLLANLPKRDQRELIDAEMGDSEAFAPEPVAAAHEHRLLAINMTAGNLEALAGEYLAAGGVVKQIDKGLHSIHVPAIVIQGTKDNLVPPTYGRHLAADLPGARLEMLYGGHMQPYYHPAAIAAAVRSLQARPAGSAPDQPAGAALSTGRPSRKLTSRR